ncbi:MAG: 3-dehydroquinate synthase [Planctomycetota bacterium]
MLDSKEVQFESESVAQRMGSSFAGPEEGSQRSREDRAKNVPASPSDGVADISFSVPFVHRLRTTNDLAHEDFHVLSELLQPSVSERAKVLVIAEDALSGPGSRVQAIYSRLAVQFETGGDVAKVTGGEAIKNDPECIHHLLQLINERDLDRRSYIVAIGGGAMLDAVGYAAAIAHRGIRLIRVPTTTLAQGDSGVGVKNAINYFGKKNWVGTFNVPWAVINDGSFLESLQDRDFCSGFSEAVKVSLLKSRAEFDWLCDHATDIRNREKEFVSRAIGTSCRLHLRHITEGGDPFEMLEARPLDFGHWSAHRLEPLTDYELRHGEAVAIGVALDCFYSQRALEFPLADVDRVCRCLRDLGLPLWHPAIDPPDRLLSGLEEFRQHLGGRLTITLLRGVGESVDVHEIDQSKMLLAIEDLRAWVRANSSEMP